MIFLIHILRHKKPYLYDSFIKEQPFTHFPGDVIANRMLFFQDKDVPVRQKHTDKIHIKFPRASYFLFKQTSIFKKTLCHQTDKHFSGKHPLSNRYSRNRSLAPFANIT